MADKISFEEATGLGQKIPFEDIVAPTHYPVGKGVRDRMTDWTMRRFK